MKCFTCGREIQNGYRLDGKVYGHECYKMALSLKYIHLQELKNDDWTKKCIAAITVFENVEYKDKWNQEFKQSILNQWASCNKLTGKQLEVMLKKIDYIEYTFSYLAQLEDEEKIRETNKNLYYWIEGKQEELVKYKNDERFINVVKNQFKNKRYIITSKDIDEKKAIVQIVRDSLLEEYKNDEYIEILEIIEA